MGRFGSDDDQYLMHARVDQNPQVHVTGLLIGFLILTIAGCTTAFAAEIHSRNPVAQIALPKDLVLPPAWTATPIQATPTAIYNPPPVANIPPTQSIQTPLFMHRETRIIGYSVEGRPLKVLQFGSGPRNLLIVAGIHGGYEWNTIALAERLIEYINQHPQIIPLHVSLHILPSLNPDGAQRRNSPFGRGNANAVDLNRNWDSHWSIDVPKPNCWDIVPLTAGPRPSSEPEIQALMNFILEENFDALISYHSASLGIFPGGIPSSTASLSLAEAVAEVSDYPFPPIDIGCEYTGTFTDWAADHGIAAIDIELSTHRSTDFEQNVLILQTFLNWRP